MTKNTFWLNSALIQVVVLIAACMPYCINLGKSSIWDANEAFYAETPREMLTSGNYLAPHFNFQPRVQKPPLTYWAILVSYKLFGVNEFAVRLPSALAAIGTILFSYGIARLLFNPHAALFSAVMTATTARIFILARRLPIDILLLFFLTGTLFFLVQALQKHSSRSWAFAYAFAGLGFLTKGPVAVFIPACAYLLWALYQRRRIPETHPLLGTAIFLLIVLPWYITVYRVWGWTYISPFFLRDNFGRFAAETLGPSRNILYYVSVYAVDFFPWSILLLASGGLLWLHRKAEPVLKSACFGLPIFWCVLTFVFFSLSKNKQEYYIAPMYPVAAVLIAGVLDRVSARGHGCNTLAPGWDLATGQRLLRWIFGISAVLLLLLSSIFPYMFSSFMPGIPAVLHYAPSVLLVGGFMALICSMVRRDHTRSFLALAVPLWAIYMMGALSYLPALESFRPVKNFCRIIKAQSSSEDEAGFFNTALPSMAFYLQRPIFEETDAEQMLRRFQSGHRVFCVLSRKDLGYFSDKKDLTIHIMDRHPRFAVRLSTLLNAGYFPGEELLLVSNQPNSGQAPGRSGAKL
jgi:4-amino-4-deoxy-L-arabinose transferase-like glycosyltransferase